MPPPKGMQDASKSSGKSTIIKFVLAGVVCVCLAGLGCRLVLNRNEPLTEGGSSGAEQFQPFVSDQVNIPPPAGDEAHQVHEHSHTSHTSHSSSSSSDHLHPANSSSEKIDTVHTAEKVGPVAVQWFRLKSRVTTFFAPTRNKLVFAAVVTLVVVAVASVVIRLVVLADAQEVMVVDPVIPSQPDKPDPPVIPSPPAEPSMADPRAYAESLLAEIHAFFAADGNSLAIVAAVGAAIVLGGVFAAGVVFTCTRNVGHAAGGEDHSATLTELVRKHRAKIFAAVALLALLVIGATCTAVFAPDVFSIYLLIGLYVVALFLSALMGPIGGTPVFGAIALFGGVALIVSVVVYVLARRKYSQKIQLKQTFAYFREKLSKMTCTSDDSRGHVLLALLSTFVLGSIVGTMVAFFVTDLWWIGGIVIAVSGVAFFTVGRIVGYIQNHHEGSN